MLSALVYLAFFALVFFMWKSNTEDRFFLLFVGTILFPYSGTFIESPEIAPYHVLIYVFFALEFLENFDEIIRTISRNRILVPMTLLVVSVFLTVFYNEGFSPKAYYVMARYLVENYGFLIAAFYAGRKLNLESFCKKLYKPLMVYLVLGVLEALAGTNLIFKFICSAYPNYTGIPNLNGTVSFVADWRTRIFISTDHPTSLGCLLTYLFAVYMPFIRTSVFKKSEVLLILGLLLLDIYLSGSRTALLCTFFIAAFYIVNNMHILFRLMVVALLCFSMTVIVQMAVDAFENSKGSNLELRMTQLVFSYEAISRSPILGNGMHYVTNNIFIYSDSKGDSDKKIAMTSSGEYLGGLESIVFRLMIDYGILGLLVFYLILFYYCFIMYRKRKVNVACTSGYLFVIAFVLFLTLSGTIANSIVYGYMMLGLCVGNLELEEGKDLEDEISEDDETISCEK